MAPLSPMMQQYFDIKNRYGKYILFFRLGDFYEMFYDDAVTASKELDLMLTGRDCGQEERAPMCGVPFHSCDAYIARLISRGYKVAICEQTEDPALAKGLVKRDVIRLITPGTLTETGMLEEGRNNYLASVSKSGKVFGLAFVDVSTGAVSCTHTSEGIQAVMCEFARFSPRELLLDPNLTDADKEALQKGSALVGEFGIEEEYNPEFVAKRLRDSFGCTATGGERAAEEAALCAAVGYVEEVYKGGLRFSADVDWYLRDRYMSLDPTARRNLEIDKNMATGEKSGSLLAVLDRTRTPMGRRLLAEYVQRPLMDCVLISKRQNAIAQLCADDIACESLSELLGGIFDLERIITRVCCGSANGRELRSLCGALARLPALKTATEGFQSAMLSDIHNQIDPMEDLFSLIDGAIVDEPPLTITDGGLIKNGFDSEADRLRGLLTNSQDALAAIENSEREKSGIRQLKIGYNRVFGYYLEVSKSNLDAVPDYFIRKQTLTNGERFITPELKELENDILQARTRLTGLEYELFCKVRAQVAACGERVRQTARAVAALDVFVSLARVAMRNNYCRPEVDNSNEIIISDGRHPVVELNTSSGFVPNDVRMNCGDDKILIITGPNMAGKSTYMRQTALIVIMAQIGSFVPASGAKIGVVDAVFTRVGASDDLAGGRSTFMVEMSELAYILKNATRSSLVILDEIGRGTSTFDGMSIARAVAEYLADDKKIGAKTLFATHYHELCGLEAELACVKNYNTLVKKRGDDITFLRKVVRGGADDSYGIEVSKLAGVPDAVTKRAKVILAGLEANRNKEVWADSEKDRQNFADGSQGSFSDICREQLLQRLRNLDINSMTPIEALSLLGELCDEARKT